MDADWSVELGADDPVLEFPWRSADGCCGYIDLLNEPALVTKITEAATCPELSEFLLALNRPRSPWLSAKCDIWRDGELGEAESIYDASLKFCSYVDLVRRDTKARFSFEQHETWARSAAHALSSGGQDLTSAEFIVRRCWFHADGQGDADDLIPGLYVTFYLFGYGRDESEARSRWANGLRQATSVLTAAAL